MKINGKNSVCRRGKRSLLKGVTSAPERHAHHQFFPADFEERKFWNQYIQAYEGCLSATSTHDSPWYVVPADDKENARLIIAQIVLDTFKSLELAYPAPSAGYNNGNCS